MRTVQLMIVPTLVFFVKPTFNVTIENNKAVNEAAHFAVGQSIILGDFQITIELGKTL